MGMGRMGYAGTAFLSRPVLSKNEGIMADVDDMIETPFGLFPMGDAATGNAAESLGRDHNTSPTKFEPHWLFAHLFDEEGRVKL